MEVKEQIRGHIKDGRWIVGGLAALLIVLSLIFYFLQRSRDLPSELVTNRLLLFVLFYINLTLILAIFFVLLRNLFKLLVERHHRILGSKFKTKLVATYIGLSLLPGLLLFAYGSQLLHGWVDRWFDEPAVREVLTQGHQVSQELYRRVASTRLRDTRRVLAEIRDLDLDNPRRRPRLDRRLRRLLEELELDSLAIYSGTHFVHAVLNSESALSDLPEPGERFLIEVVREGEGRRWQSLAGSTERLVLAAVADKGELQDSPTVVVSGALIDAEIAASSRNLIQAYQGYRQLEVSKTEIQAGYLLTFLMVTLLILLASSWVGLYLAKRITVPIQALAEGTRRVSEGELDFHIDVEADDELGVLVRSFNTMTDELQRGKELLEESNLELVATNARLAEERAVIAAVLQNVAAGVISLDHEGRILTCNEAALRMLKQPRTETVGRPIGKVWSDSERSKLVSLFETDAKARRTESTHLRLLLDGAWRTFEAKVTTMVAPNGRVRGKVMVLEDLTELVKAQQTAAWSEAARRIAHEIKNPLTPIRLSAERLLRRYKEGDPSLGIALEESVEVITREVQAMKSMVDEFSRFARMPAPRPSQVDVGKLLEDTIGLYEGLKVGVNVEGIIDDDARRAWLDEEQMKRVLINLLDNAFDATEAPGKVSVAVHKNNGNLQIEVADNGKGILPEAKDKLFLPHFSTKGRGTGLGLSIVHRIISDHHGTIRAESNSPRGTVFRITLPQS